MTNSNYHIDIRELNIIDDHIEYCNLLRQLSTIDVDSIDHRDYVTKLRSILDNPNHRIIIACVDHKIVATITLLIEPKIIHNLSNVAHIEDLVVDVNYRSCNIGKKLVKYVIDIAKKMKCYKIILDCSDTNISYYNMLGFTKRNNQMEMRFDI